MDRTDYVNAITSLSLLCISPDNLHDSVALYCFTIIATLDHIIPEQYRNNNLIKPLFDQLILKDGILKNVITISDIININNKNALVGTVGGSIRQFVICKDTLDLFHDKPLLLLFSLMCKIIYLYERHERIAKNERNSFGMLHCVEHIDLLLYFYYKLKHNERKTIIRLSIFFLTTGLFMPSTMFKLVNIYLYYNYKSRLPKWFDNSLLPYYDKKITGNYNSTNIFNYIVKIYSYQLNWNFMSWGVIEKKLNILATKIKNDNFKPDIFIGILSGGAFCVKYLSNLFDNKNVFYIKCVQWSNTANAQKAIQTFKYHTQTQNEYVNNCKNEIHDINNNIDAYKAKFKSKKSLNVLLFDDTVSTGKTIHNVKKYLYEKFDNLDNVVIKTACIITNDDKNQDYIVDTSTINVIWEWGVELD